MEMVMNTGVDDPAHPILESFRNDGTHWLFVTLSGDRWAIICDEEQVLVGTSSRASISSGVQQYLSLVGLEHPA